MRFRLFGKIRHVPKPAVIAVILLVCAIVIVTVKLTEKTPEMPEIIREGVGVTPGEELTQDGEGSIPSGGALSEENTFSPTPGPTPDTRLAVHITGAVSNEGVYRLPPGSIVDDVIGICGGLLPDADTYSVNLAMKINDGMRIHIPFIYSDNKTWLLDVGYASVSGNGLSESGSESRLVNINTASVNELVTLNGIGESTARDIIAFREEYGKFGSIEEIMNVPGIKEAKFGKIKKSITV